MIIVKYFIHFFFSNKAIIFFVVFLVIESDGTILQYKELVSNKRNEQGEECIRKTNKKIQVVKKKNKNN